MDHENCTAEGKANSLFQVDRTFLKKILARKSFKGQSMRMFHTENVVSVPFDWERQPGTPKHPQTEIVPPIKPPPAVESQTLEKPNFANSTHTTMSCFRKKSRNNNHRQGRKSAKAKVRQGDFDGNNTKESVEFSDLKVDSILSRSDHSRSSSVSTTCSSNTTSSSSSSNSSSLRSFAKGLIKWSF